MPKDKGSFEDEVNCSGPEAPLPKDPQPSVDRIDELARRILEGDILLPRFQREFVWKRHQIISLLDSIARNYPIGSILLWQSRQELRSESRIADLEIKLPKAQYPVNYLLDGQQRLSTICGALNWNGSDPKSRWNLAYNLRNGEFIHLDSLEDPPLHLVRMNKVGNPASFYKHVMSLETLGATDKNDLKESADKLFNRFKDYKIAAVTLGDMSIRAVAPIFERINSKGTRLTVVDLMRAATWSQDFDLIDAIDDLRNGISAKGFSGIDRKVVLRSISAAAGGGFSVSSIDDLRGRTSDSLDAATKSAADAYDRTVDYLSTQISIPSDAVIPYANQIVVLVEIFRRIPTPDAKQYEAISHWFWKTAVSGYFSGWNTGNMSTDQDAVARFARRETPDIAVAAVDPSSRIWTKRTMRRNGAHAKTLAILLSYQQPKDMLTGQRIDVDGAMAWTNEKEFHHLFPRSFLKNRGVHQSRVNCLANIVLLTSASNKRISDQAPSKYLAQVAKVARDNLEDWLHSNLITTEAYECALKDDYDGFLSARAEAIHAAASELAGWSSGS